MSQKPRETAKPVDLSRSGFRQANCHVQSQLQECLLAGLSWDSFSPISPYLSISGSIPTHDPPALPFTEQAQVASLCPGRAFYAPTSCRVCSEPFPWPPPRAHACLITAEPAWLTQDHRHMALSGPECTPDVQLTQSKKSESHKRISKLQRQRHQHI